MYRNRSFIAGIACSMLLSLQACAPAASAPAPRTTPVASFAPPPSAEEFAFAPSGVKAGARMMETKKCGLRPAVISDKDMKKGLVTPE